MLTIQLLGGACLRDGDAPLNGPPAQRHRIALLALIVAAWPRPLSRDRAMALLWPERDTANARRLLNLAVHVLRSALGDSAIASTGDGLLFNPSHAQCDLHELRSAIADDAPERIVRLYAGTLLDGFHLDESIDFGYWLDERRVELEHAYVGALRTLARCQEQEGDMHGRVGTCRRLVATDPHSSLYARELMRALAAAGDRAGAIEHAAEHARRRRVDLELTPDADVVALAEQLRVSAANRHVATSGADARIASVAVLPFINLTPDAENEFFADGITEDVIAHLAKIRALRVIARSSVTPFKQRHGRIAEIGASLGATTLLDGSVRRSGDRVRIVATLLDAVSERPLWSETYDRQLDDIFAIQTDVALCIAAALEAELTRDEQSRVRREPTHDVHAYQLYLQGRQWFSAYSPDAYTRAIECFDRAIARDASFALAHAAVAMAYIELGESGATDPAIARRHAAESAATALALDPELGAAYCTMAHRKTVHEFDWAGAERDFTRAIELSPSNAEAYDLYGRLCAAQERFDDATSLLTRAQELDPLAHRVDVATTLLRAGRYDDAVRSAENAVELDPAHDRSRATLGWAYFFSGKRAEGLAELERAVALSPGNTLWASQLGQAYAIAGETTKARAIVRRLEKAASHGYVSPYHLAYVYTGLADVDRAMDALERAVRQRAGGVYGVKGSFLFRSLHDEPRFRALLREMNLA